jgi:dihydrofolate reductase
MAKLILEMQCSLDGFVCGPRGELDWIFPDVDADYTAWTVERLWRAAAHLMGGVTYRDMAAHWPVSKEPFAEPMNAIPKIVFSSSIERAEWGETEVFAGDPAEQVARLKRERQGELLAHGGVRFAQTLIRAKLIDEYRFVAHPVALGRGRSVFADLAEPLRLAPVGQTAFKSGVVAIELRPPAPA